MILDVDPASHPSMTADVITTGPAATIIDCIRMRGLPKGLAPVPGQNRAGFASNHIKGNALGRPRFL